MMVAYKHLCKEGFKESTSHYACGKTLACIHPYCGRFTVIKNSILSFKSIVYGSCVLQIYILGFS